MKENSQHPMQPDSGSSPADSLDATTETACASPHRQLRHRIILILILMAYALLGSLYAFLTPAWQVPDEPAHYNYIQQLIEQKRLPILKPGDYDQALLDRSIARGFPATEPVHALKYQNHQPPLYYLLAVPIYLSSNGSLRILRLFSLVLGSGIILFACAITNRLCPEQPLIALGTAAFIAFLPQHNAMMAGVNNDCLAGLIAAAALYLSVRIVQEPAGSYFQRLVLGIVLGLGLLTKVTVYPILLVALAAVWQQWRKNRDASMRCLVRNLMCILIPAFILAAPWWIRNALVYGGGDILGLIRHGTVVEGQPRTGEWIEWYGWYLWLRRGMIYTMQSFLGQFGWMSIVMDFRVYLSLVPLMGLAGIGWLMSDFESKDTPKSKRIRMPGGSLLAILFLLTVFQYLAYNAFFVQHQGRYLFPALIPIAFVFSFGWDRLFQYPFHCYYFARLMVIAILVFMVLGVLTSNIKWWSIFILGSYAGALYAIYFLPKISRILIYLFPFILLFLVNFHAIFHRILPGLR